MRKDEQDEGDTARPVGSNSKESSSEASGDLNAKHALQPESEPDPSEIPLAAPWKRFHDDAGYTFDDPTQESFGWLTTKLWNEYQTMFAALCPTGYLCDGVARKPSNQEIQDRKERRLPAWCTCRAPLCPSCWIRYQTDALSLFEKVEAPYWHLRSTHWAQYPKGDKTLSMPGSVIKRFQAHDDPRLRPISWTIDFNVNDDEDVETWMTSDGNAITQRVYKLDYRFIGLFASNEPSPNHKFRRQRDGSIQKENGDIYDKDGQGIGSVDTTTAGGKEDAIELWFEAVRHPVVVLKGLPSDLLRDAIIYFRRNGECEFRRFRWQNDQILKANNHLLTP